MSGERLKKLEDHFKFTLDIASRKALAKEMSADKQHEMVTLNSSLATHAKQNVATLREKEYLQIMGQIFPADGKIKGIKPGSPADRPEWDDAVIAEGKPTSEQLMQQTCWLIEQECTQKATPDRPAKTVAEKLEIFNKYIGCLARATYELQMNQDLGAEQKAQSSAALGKIGAQPLQASQTAPKFLDRFDDPQRRALIAAFREATYELLFRDAIVTKQVSALLLDCNSLRLDSQMRQRLQSNAIVTLTDSETKLLNSLDEQENRKADERKETDNKLAFDHAFNLAVIDAIQKEREFTRKTYNSESFFEYLGRKIHAQLIGMNIPPAHGSLVTKDTMNPANLYRGKYFWALYGQFDENGKWVDSDTPVFYYRTDCWYKTITSKTFNRGSLSDARLIFSCIEEFVRFCNPHDANDITNPKDIGGNVPVNGLMYLLQCMDMAIHPRPDKIGLPIYVKDDQGNVYDLASAANRNLLIEFQKTGNRNALTKILPMGKVDEKGKLQTFKDEELDKVSSNLYETVYSGTYQSYLNSTPTAFAVNPFERMCKKLQKKYAGNSEPIAQAMCGSVGTDDTITEQVHFDVCAMYLLNGHGELWGKKANAKKSATAADLASSLSMDDDVLGLGVNPRPAPSASS